MTRGILTAVCAAAVLGVAGCGDDEEGSAGPEKVTITSTADKIEVPKTVKAGAVELTLDNKDKRPHEVELIRVDGDQTLEDVLKVVDSEEEGGPIPPWLHGAGGTAAGAGKSTQVLEPGRYFAIDDSNEQDEKAKPLTAELEVTGEVPADAAEKLPKAPVTIKASEYEFEAGPLKQGKNTVLFDNTGKELHHAIVAPYAEGASAAEVKKFLESDEEPKGPPPLDFESAVNTAVMDGGQKQVIDLDLKKPGKYVMVCFIQDRKGGPPHVAKGMVEEFEVQ